MVPNNPYTSSLRVAFAFSYWSALTPICRAGTPVAAKWSARTFGPDGPWPAVEVVFGDDLASQQTVALYPGHEFQTFLVASTSCDYEYCDVPAGGAYDPLESGSSDEIQYEPPDVDFMKGVLVKGGYATSWTDTIQLEAGDTSTIPTVSLALLNDALAEYPGGELYQLSMGCLGIGGAGAVNQTFTEGYYEPAINASLIPGYLWSHGQLDSNSFGMHIGSANPYVPGSLYFGGYDQNRVLGDVITKGGSEEDTGATANEFLLKDISIDVVDGSSPFNFSGSATGLLAQNDAPLEEGLYLRVDGCSPYLTLPSSTCQAIAQHLPVTYSANLGLWLWNTNDPQYSTIVNSASALSFVFEDTAGEVTISVPFRHLNLTLESPLVETPQPYFPCYDGVSSDYTLGRAFLQDAFFGANWGQSVWWLAQAPGPNIKYSAVVAVEQNDVNIKASSNDWKESWSGSWVALSPAQASGGTSVGTPTGTLTPTATTSSGPQSTPSVITTSGSRGNFDPILGTRGAISLSVGVVAFWGLGTWVS
ncbi:aspartic peptidase domain-containing protein [Xylariales sp. PMI_506]|nr:aspartic peptidase domain-containing protein [Xylariales sp. PMI_506]